MRAYALFITLAAALGAHGAKAAEIVIAGGCFWCVEADFEKVDGVTEAISGYTGGTTEDPTYRQVINGGTGHYEAVRVEYDPDEVDLETLYHLFFRSVDPTDPGGQFCDRGHRYTTAIFVDTPEQRRAAEAAKAQAAADLDQPVVTDILPLTTFYTAEDYHQDYYKGDNRTLTRFGWIPQSEAYSRYRAGCGRDERVRELWGNAAPFAG